jgi:glycosyltransferase involved in cell wall biosynthesis
MNRRATPPGSVTVVIPTRNRWPWLADAIDSALKHSHPSTQVIVVDDASSDGSAEHVKSRYSDRVHLNRNPRRAEESRSRNAVRCPRGRILPQDLSDSSRLANNAILLKRSLILNSGMYRPELTHMEDRELLLRLTARVPFRFCGAVTHRFRRVDRSARRQDAEILRQGHALTAACGMLRTCTEITRRNRRVRRRMCVSRASKALRVTDSGESSRVAAVLSNRWRPSRADLDTP